MVSGALADLLVKSLCPPIARQAVKWSCSPGQTRQSIQTNVWYILPTPVVPSVCGCARCVTKAGGVVGGRLCITMESAAGAASHFVGARGMLKWMVYSILGCQHINKSLPMNTQTKPIQSKPNSPPHSHENKWSLGCRKGIYLPFHMMIHRIRYS